LGRLVGDRTPKENFPLLEEFFLNLHANGRGRLRALVLFFALVIIIIVEARKWNGKTGVEIVE
ncbi:MAG TPA: hypothetical protein VNW23_09210, partial [Opitutaceae bacterium]|nr:hypothetical protein [Opitutaceae bacterium]